MLSTKVIFVQYFCLSEVKGMDKNMKIAVCDSDKDFLNKVEVILQKVSKNNEVPYITFKYENSYELECKRLVQARHIQKEDSI